MKMRKKVKRFVPGLFGRSSHNPLEMVVNADVIVKQLKIEKLAIKAGKRNHPRSDATQPDANEDQITRYHQGLLQYLNQSTSEMLQHLQQQRSALREQLDPKRFDELIAEARQALDRLRNRWKYALIETAKRERQAHCDLKAFKLQNRLMREAQRPIPPLLLWLGISTAIVVEGIVNAWAFADVSFGGWISALQQAMIISAINVLCASAAGVAARNLCHIAWHRFLFGCVTTGGYFSFLFGYTLMIGHLRMAILENPETAFSQAIYRMAESPVSITDFNSMVLMLTSCGLALAAFVAGFKATDPYPGYAQITQHYRERLGHMHACRQQYLGAIDTDTEPYYRSAIDARLTAAHRARDQFRHNIIETKRAFSAYRRCSADIEASHVYCVQLYRQVNEEIRDTNGPAYTQQTPRAFEPADFLEVSEYAFDHDEQFPENFLELASRLAEVADEARNRIRDLRTASRQAADAFFAETEVMAAGNILDEVPGTEDSDQVKDIPQSAPSAGESQPVVHPCTEDHTEQQACFLKTVS